mgnify:CR=1
MDSTGLLILGLAALAFMHSRTKVVSGAAPPGVPNVQREVDVTRWRHDGSQPLFYTKGNGASFVDETASGLQASVF